MTQPFRQARRALWPALFAALGLAVAGCPRNSDPPPSAAPPPPAADFEKQVNSVCSHCHAFPPADTFPRSAWKEEVEQAYRFSAAANLPMVLPPIDSVVTYFE